MALSRKLLESMGLESDKVSSIIDAHAETVDGLKAKIEEYKADAEKYKSTQEALDKALKELDDYKEAGGDWQKKYEAEHEAYEAFKTEQEQKELTATKRNAYRKLLKDSGVSEKAMELILKTADVNAIEIEDGEIKDADKHAETIKKEYADFIVSTHTSGSNTTNPPETTGGGTKTKEEIMAIKDPTERQQAIKDNPGVFGY